jgi:hypothetical protein
MNLVRRGAKEGGIERELQNRICLRNQVSWLFAAVVFSPQPAEPEKGSRETTYVQTKNESYQNILRCTFSASSNS